MNIKLISAGGGLVAFGALLGWAFTADRWEQRLKEQIDSQQDRITLLRKKLTEAREQQIVQNLYIQNLSGVGTDENNSEKSPGGDSAETEVTDEEDEVDEAAIEAERSRLQELINEYNADPEASSAEAKRIEIMDRNAPPFIISHGDFSFDEEGDEYAKITLTYYPRHKILLDEDEEPIRDVANYVDWRNLTRFGDQSNDPNVVFVRNRRLRTDFEVVQDEENDIPLHVKYSMPKDEFDLSLAAGVLKLRPEDLDRVLNTEDREASG